MLIDSHIFSKSHGPENRWIHGWKKLIQSRKCRQPLRQQGPIKVLRLGKIHGSKRPLALDETSIQGLTEAKYRFSGSLGSTEKHPYLIVDPTTCLTL